MTETVQNMTNICSTVDADQSAVDDQVSKTTAEAEDGYDPLNPQWIPSSSKQAANTTTYDPMAITDVIMPAESSPLFHLKSNPLDQHGAPLSISEIVDKMR
jgi:hypothetical protein